MDGSLSVLIVGPEPSVLQSMRDVLRRDYRILTAASMPRAVALLNRQRIDLVLADHQPPAFNGMAFLRQVRRDHPESLRFLFTSSADSWVASAAAGQGHDFRFISQPWDAEELQALLRQAVEERQQADESWPAAGDAHARPLSLAPGTRLGQYELLERRGEGGMGTVYKAVHGLLKRVVALKVLSPALVSDPSAITRFRREIEAVGRLQHPHIVQASDANEVGGTHFLVMEYVDGLDLAEVLARHGPLPVPEACAIIHQALAGLQHAFEHNLVHRDIKPGNLMLTPQGQVKILDFGLALLYDDPSHEDLMAGGRIAGTVDYLAPEVARGPQATDTRSDLYSLGCTFYELLTGQPPFSGSAHATVLQKLLAHAQAAPPPLRERRPEVDDQLARIVNRFLAKDPSQRFARPASAGAVLEPFGRGAELGRFFASLAPSHEPGRGQPTEDYSPPA